MTTTNRETLACNVAGYVESVLPLFEMRYPDDRPRKAIEAARAWAAGEITIGAARTAAFAAHAAARSAENPASRAVARAAGHTAAIAHVAGHARHAIAYADAAKRHYETKLV